MAHFTGKKKKKRQKKEKIFPLVCLFLTCGRKPDKVGRTQAEQNLLKLLQKSNKNFFEDENMNPHEHLTTNYLEYDFNASVSQRQNSCLHFQQNPQMN